MSIKYARERWEDVWPELAIHWPAHWREVAMDKDKMHLDPDLEEYQRLENAGKLCAIVARTHPEGEVVGYHVNIISTHIHYRKVLCAFTDMYYIAPGFRKGRVGVEIFKEAEKVLLGLGVQKIHTSTKVHKDVGRIFERLGYRDTERVFTKYVGE